MKKLAFLIAVLMLAAAPFNCAAAGGITPWDGGQTQPDAEPALFILTSDDTDIDSATHGIDTTMPHRGIVENANAREYYDVGPSDWFYPYITELSRRSLTRGYPDGGYAPDSPLLVDEFIAFTLRTLGEDAATAEGYWAQGFIELALRLNLIDEGQFERYDVPITRGQIAEIAVRAAENGHIFTFEKYENYRDLFSDVALMANPEPILKAVELGVIAGYGDHSFRPSATATRAEAAVIVLRMIDESYRLSLYDGVFFNPITDLDEDGEIKKEKALEFVMKSVENLWIIKVESGKAYIYGDIPYVPEGYYFNLAVSFFDDSDYRYLGYASTLSVAPNECITYPGPFELMTEVDVDAVGSISIVYSISKILYPDKPRPYHIGGSPQGFYINKYYVPGNNGILKDEFTTDYSHTSGDADLDFALTDGIWGW